MSHFWSCSTSCYHFVTHVPLGCCHVDRWTISPFPDRLKSSTTTTSNLPLVSLLPTNMVHGRSTRATTNPVLYQIKKNRNPNKIRTTGGVLKLRRIPGIGDNDEGASLGPDAAPQPSASHDPSSIGEGRSRSAQRWMKLRTTVQLTSAISNTVAQSKKTSLKREDSFIARFSTRQIPEAQVN